MHRGPAASFVHRWFTDPASRGLYPVEGHARHSREFVADHRTVLARRGRDDDEAAALVAGLLALTEVPTALWRGGQGTLPRP